MRRFHVPFIHLVALVWVCLKRHLKENRKWKSHIQQLATWTMKSCSHTWNIKLTKKGLSFSCTTSSSWGILLVTLGFLKKNNNVENRSMAIKKIKLKNTTQSQFFGKVWYSHCNKRKEQWKNECQRWEIYLLLFTKYNKIKTIPLFFPPWWMGHYNRLCMYHEVYQQLVVIFVVTSRICITEYLQ